MSTTKSPEKAQFEAHTPGDATAPGADLDTLMAGSPDLDGDDLLSVCAELASAPRRERGRPQGALNRKNADMISYLQAKGHRDPWVTLSMIQSADTAQLAHSMSMKRGDALALQLRAADAIMPYHHSKRPQQVELDLTDKRRPLMSIGELNINQVNMLDGVMSAGIAPTRKVIDNQTLSKSDAVRETKRNSHETDK